MVRQSSLLSQLESVVGAEGLADDPAAFPVDGLIPRGAVLPATYDQVAEVMRYAHAEGLAVVPWGGGTHVHIGNVPGQYDIALSLTRLNHVVEHEPADLTVTCQAGITLSQLQGHLNRHGQLVPLGSMHGDGATVGGVLAANASGLQRHAYGPPRDFTIGMRVVTADGRVTRAGGRVVKNVAGYDLGKLYIGSLGTLGIIVEAGFKLPPLPAARRTVLATIATAEEACSLTAQTRQRGLALEAAQLFNNAAAAEAGISTEGRYSLVLQLAGSPQAVERSRTEISELVHEAAGDIADTDTPAPGVLADGADLICKATVLPTNTPGLVETLERIDGEPRIVAWPTVGVVYASWGHLDDARTVINRLRALTAAEGGSLVIECCPTAIKHELDVFGEPPPSFGLMRRLKAQFDPKNILSPGRYVGRL